MKRKRRFLLLRLRAADAFSEAQARALADETVLESLGEQGSSRAEFRLKFFNASEQLLLVQCALDSMEAVVAAFALKRFSAGRDVSLRLEKVFGTLKKAVPLFPGVSRLPAKARNKNAGLPLSFHAHPRHGLVPVPSRLFAALACRRLFGRRHHRPRLFHLQGRRPAPFLRAQHGFQFAGRPR
jgi:RNase P/RNase MRP subunit POP5